MDDDPPPTSSPVRPVPRPGFRGTARYQVVRKLGAGAAGEVWSVVDHVHERIVALKSLPFPDGEHTYWLKQEFRSLAGLSHPNLVSLYELEADAEHCFFTMEQIDGQPFDVALRPRGGGYRSDELHRVRALVRQLAAGLHALHRHGRLHRDIKPSNVLVTEEGRVVLLDFGLVTSMESAGRAEGGLVVGTLAYASPEQGLGQPVGPAADWYSAGVMLYEGLTGEKPFHGSFFDNIMDRQGGRFRPVAEREPTVPEDLAALVHALLNPSPDDRPGALAIFQQLGLAPDREPGASVLGQDAGTGAFLGRSMELGALRRARERADGARRVLVRVRGPSGIGKTALVRQFLAGLGPELLALRGRCHPRETLPLIGLDGIVDGLSRQILAAPPERRVGLDLGALARLAVVFPVFRAVYSGPRPPVGSVDRHATFDSLAQVLSQLADDRLVVLWVDDLQWSDPDSAAALRTLLERGPERLLVLVSYPSASRDTAVVAELEAGALSQPGIEVRTLPVGPLGAEVVETLVARLAEGAEDADRLRLLAAQAGGSPFALSVLLRAATRPGGLEGVEELAGALRAELGALGVAERRLLEVLAAAGRPLDLGVARAAALVGERARPEVVLESVELVRTLIADQGIQLELSHNLVREAVLAGLDGERRRKLHRSLARVMRALAPSGGSELLDHVEGAGRAEDAVKLAVHAAEAARAAGAPELAASLFGRAARLAVGDPERWRWVAARAEALALAGRGGAAAKAWMQAVGLRGAQDPHAPEVAAMRREAAGALLRSGRWAAGVELLRAVLGEVGLELPTGGDAARALWWPRARLWVRGLRPGVPAEAPDAWRERRADACWAAAVGLALVEPVRAAVFHAHFVRDALTLGDADRVARALASEAAVQLGVGGDLARAERALADARAQLSEVERPSVHALVALGEAAVRFQTGELGAVLRWTARAEAALEGGPGWERTAAGLLSTWALAWAGDLGVLRRRLPELLREARDRGDLLAAATLGTGWPTIAWIADGRSDLVLQHADQSTALWHHERGFHVQHWLNLVARVHLELAQGRPARGLGLLEAALPELDVAGLRRLEVLRGELAWLRGRTALAAGGAAAVGVDRDAAALERMGSWWPALGAQLRAGLALAQGRTQLAQDALEQAHARAEEHGLRLHAAIYGLALGRVEGGGGGVQRQAQARLELERLGVLEREAVWRVVGAGLELF